MTDKNIEIYEYDDSPDEMLASLGHIYPKEACGPSSGFIVHIKEVTTTFFGRLEDFDGFIIGCCAQPHKVWTFRTVHDLSSNDLYIRRLELPERLWMPRNNSISLQKLNLKKGGHSEKIAQIPFNLAIEYVHDVHDHSYYLALASALMVCQFDLLSGHMIQVVSVKEKPPPKLSKESLMKMQPGDYVSIGKGLLEALSKHLLKEANKKPVIHNCK